MRVFNRINEVKKKTKKEAFFRSGNTTLDTSDLFMAISQEFVRLANYAVLQARLRLNPD